MADGETIEVPAPCRLIKCSRCCMSTQMILLPEDIERLEKLGYRREEFAVCDENGVCKLRNIGGRCYFLDAETGLCRVYTHRPLGCRLYPLICIEAEGMAVDGLCPAAETILQYLKEHMEVVVKAAKLIEEKLSVRCPPRLMGVYRE